MARDTKTHLEVELLLELKKFKKGTTSATGMLSKFSSAATSAFKKVATSAIVLGAAIRGIATAATVLAAKFEYAMAEVSTLVQDTSGFERYRDQVMDIAYTTGERAADVARATYQTISAGFISAQQAGLLLETATKAGIAGISDTETAVRVLSGSLNAYDKTAEEAAHFSDVLFTTVRLGVTTFGELADSIGNLTTLASSAAVSFEEINAALVALTKRGIRTPIAVMMLRTVIAAILKPTAEAAELAEKLGLQFNAAGLRAKGLHGFMEDLRVATKGDIELLLTLVPQIRGAAAVLTLAGEGAGDFTEAIAAMGLAAGATDTAFDKMRATLSFQWKRYTQNFKTMLIEAAEPLLPVLTEIFERAADRMQAFGERVRHFFRGLAKGLGIGTDEAVTPATATGVAPTKAKSGIKAEKSAHKEMNKLRKQFAADDADAQKAVNKLREQYATDEARAQKEMDILRKQYAADEVQAQRAMDKLREQYGAPAPTKAKIKTDTSEAQKAARPIAAIASVKSKAQAQIQDVGEQLGARIRTIFDALVPRVKAITERIKELLTPAKEFISSFAENLAAGTETFGEAKWMESFLLKWNTMWLKAELWFHETMGRIFERLAELQTSVVDVLKGEPIWDVVAGTKEWIDRTIYAARMRIKAEFEDIDAEWERTGSLLEALRIIREHHFGPYSGYVQEWGPGTEFTGPAPSEGGEAPGTVVNPAPSEGGEAPGTVVNIDAPMTGYIGDDMVDELADKLVPRIVRAIQLKRMKAGVA